MIGFLLLMIVPQTEVVHDHCTIIEHNHFYDEHGRHVFDQLIFYDWNPHQHRYDIRDWRLVKSTNQHPIHNRVIWHDGQTMWQITAERTFTTWTQHDPELCERSILHKDQRRELTPANITPRRAKELIENGSHP